MSEDCMHQAGAQNMILLLACLPAGGIFLNFTDYYVQFYCVSIHTADTLIISIIPGMNRIKKMCVYFLYVKSLFGYEWCVPKRTERMICAWIQVQYEGLQYSAQWLSLD